MTQDSIPEEEIGKYLTAFADGELEAGETVEVLQYLARNPQATWRVVGQVQLRGAAKRCVERDAPSTSEALRSRIAALAARRAAPGHARTLSRETAGSEPGQRVDLRASPLRRLMPAAAAAACLLASVFIGHQLISGAAPSGASQAASTTGPVPPSLVLAALKTHVDCSRYAEHFHPPQFPSELATLPEAMRGFLGRPVRDFDLSTLGYEFAGAGACSLPGGKTVHLVYRAEGEQIVDTLSLFVQPDNGQLRIDPGKVYPSFGTQTAHPGFVWRDGGLVYFLIGDDATTVEKARDTFARGSAPAAGRPEA